MNVKSEPVRVIDWGRIETSLKQRFRREPKVRANIPMVMKRLQNLVLGVGEKTVSRRVLRNIGVSLAVTEDEIKIISPICLCIRPGELKKAEASKLVKSHIEFLDNLGDRIPPWRLVCLFPPPEREDVIVEKYIAEVCALTSRNYWLEDHRVSCELMTTYAPGMVAMEEIVIEEICQSPYLSNLCNGFMRQRAPYYTSLGIEYRLWPRKIRRTMAQYIILGRLAALHGYIICNHTTVNVHCAIYAGAGVLHNPVGFM